MEFQWSYLLAVLVIGGVILIAAEIGGILSHEDHKVDTISELWWSLRNRVGVLRAPLAFALGAFLTWLWWHFTMEGKVARAEGKIKAIDTVEPEEQPEFWNRKDQ